MTTLHLVFRSPAESRALEQCLARAAEGDAVLLLADGVYAAVKSGRWREFTGEAGRRVRWHALLPDLLARGLAESDLAPEIQTVDYSGFVALTVACHPIVSWS